MRGWKNSVSPSRDCRATLSALPSIGHPRFLEIES
jgi:hypothetical protein